MISSETYVPMVLQFADSLRKRGMSATAVRRAMGLSPAQAADWGLEPPAIIAKVVSEDTTSEPIAVPPEVLILPRCEPTIEIVLAAVQHATGVAREDFCVKKCLEEHKPMRQLAMYLIRKRVAGTTLVSIGHFFAVAKLTIGTLSRRAEFLLRTDASFSSLHRQVLSHIDDCETCNHQANLRDQES